MGEMISKPDANPILLAVMNLAIFMLPIGYFMMGQKKKALFALIYTVVLSCVGIGPILPWIFAYDAYLLGQKLQNGESIDEFENGLEFLSMLPGFKE